MSLTDIREQIALTLSNVDGIGVVHQYQRWVSTWEKLLDLFQDAEGRINACMITRQKTAAERQTMPLVNREHTFIIKWVYGLKDSAASELVFQDLLEAAQDQFENEYSLGGFVLNSGPLQINIVENRMFGKVLCHYAETELPATERKTYS